MNVDLKQVEEAAKELYIRALKLLPPDVKQGFDALAKSETDAGAKRMLATMIRNIKVAEDTVNLLCQNTGWFGIVAPTGTPKEIIQKVYRDTKKALESSRLKARFYVQGLAPVGNSPEEMGRAMKEESQLWARVVRERSIQVK